MRALVLDQPGTCDALRLADLPIPEPEAGQVRVRVEACALNPSDYQRAAYGISEWEWPAVLGLDVVGVVDAVGEGVRRVGVGQRVAHLGDIRVRGGFAEYTLADASVLATVPDGLEPAAAATVPAAGMTAYQAVVERLRVGRGDTVFVTGGAGGVGGFAVQFAARAGARVITTASARNTAHVKALGAEEVVDYRTEDVSARVRELTGGRGVDAVVDAISSGSATSNLAVLAPGGGLASIAGRPDLTTVPPFGLAPSVHEIALGSAYLLGDDRGRARLGTVLTGLLALLAEGELDPMLARAIALEEVPDALVELSGRGVRGKIVYVHR
ncbi:zinc-binding dehydrogenase [Lentzea sp. JNUCC 0626]|uniref:zinc-binding dehydrogenase n=1 Tax=Lentzea sp. JNUCC 0626 TaxID=3367513 RepID=UPI00374A539C